MDTIWLSDVPEPQWLAFRERGAPAAGAAPALLRSWLRSEQHGAAREELRPEHALLRGEALRLRKEHVELLERVGHNVLDRTARALSERDHVLLLADASGTLVRAQGGGQFADQARRVLLIEGAIWSEQARGTNAIGTALVEGQATGVLGRAHYGKPHHALACYAAPVRDLEGRIVALLDATSDLTRADAALAQVVATAAHALEELLRLGAYAGAGAALARTLTRTLDELRGPALLIEAPGRVARSNPAFRELIGERRAPDLRALFELDWLALSSAALSASEAGLCVRLQTRAGERAFRLHAEQIVSASGGLLSVLARLTPEARAPRAESTQAAAPAGVQGGIFAADAGLEQALSWAKKVAACDLPVMLLAETGAGKELVAQAVHAWSARASGPFVAVNCGAIAPSLLESELFGYAPGAFTGADRRGRSGLLHAASGGTLFLDEVAEMSLAMQAALLRVLETFSYRRVGEHVVSKTDARVVCATCRDLEELVASGAFRQDLYYRLKGAIIRLPPLRERSDLLALARHLLAQRARELGMPAAELTEEVQALLVRHAWPGNVRELKSVLEVALVASQGEVRIELRHLPQELRVTGGAALAGGLLKDHQSKAVRRVFEEARGNVSVAARRLGVARSTLYRLLRRHGIDVP